MKNGKPYRASTGNERTAVISRYSNISNGGYGQSKKTGGANWVATLQQKRFNTLTPGEKNTTNNRQHLKEVILQL